MRPAVLLLGVTGVAVAALLDLATGVRFGAVPLYLAPVGLVAWRLGRGAGAAIATLAAAAWLASNQLAGAGRDGALALAWNAGMQLAAFLAVALLAAALREGRERERELERSDAATGLPNRSAFRDRAALEVERARRWSRPLTLALLELDDFRVVRDGLGREDADEMLRTAAVSLRSSLRSTDLAARIGEDLFALLLPETDRNGARVVLERNLERLRQDMSRGGWPVTVSVGSVTSTDAADGEALFRQADQVLFEVRRARPSTRQAGAPAPG